MTYSHTIAALLKKRAEIAGQIEQTQSCLDGLISDLETLDKAIHIMDPDADIPAYRVIKPSVRVGGPKNEISRFIRAHLSRAVEPCTSLDIAKAYMDANDIDTGDKHAIRRVRRRVGAALNKLAWRKSVREVPSEGKYKRWEIVRG